MELVKVLMGGIVFIIGLFTSLSGLYLILRKEYQEAIKTLTAQTPKISGKSAVDEVVTPLAQASSQLLDTVNKLVQTAVGTGAFLCLLGAALCVVAYWMVSN